MGLMDKVKAQATELARDGKAKYDQAQAKRGGDALLRNLGALVYAERTGRGTPNTQAEIDKLVADISAHEAENGISLAPESADQPQGGSAAGGFPPEASAAGGFPPEASAAGGFPPEASAAGGFPPEASATSFPPEAGTTQV